MQDHFSHRGTAKVNVCVCLLVQWDTGYNKIVVNFCEAFCNILKGYTWLWSSECSRLVKHDNPPCAFIKDTPIS